MTVLSVKVNYQSFYKSLPSEMGDAYIDTKIKGSFFQGSLISNNEKRWQIHGQGFHMPFALL